MGRKFLLEVCVNSVESAIAAEKGGADRVEICEDLFEGGTTPSAGYIALCKKYLRIPCFAIIRPRGGDFCYSDIEIEVMKRDIQIALGYGADGIVTGALLPDGTVDAERMRELIEAAEGRPVTFHRAFDMTRDPIEALSTLIDMGVQRVLTSGQERTVAEGTELIAELVERAGDDIVIMPGGGVTARNIKRVLKETGAKEIHVSGRKKIDSRMQFRREHVFMGGELRLPEYQASMTDAGVIDSIIGAGS